MEPRARPIARRLPAAALLATALAVAGCGRGAAPPAGAGSGAVRVVVAENSYASVVQAVGGPYVQVTAIENNPAADPHAFEASPSVARAFASADLVVLNGLGYDAWAQKLLAAAARPGRRVVDVQNLLGLPAGTANPHLWYDPATMPAVARAVAADLAAARPAQAAYFQAGAARFDHALQPWRAAIAAFRARYAGTAVAVTEPVGDDLLQAAGCRIETPWSLQAAIMNGTDPAPQDVALQESLLQRRRVKVFLYNRQVTDPLTQRFLAEARAAGIPVVGLYETMPAGYTYPSWMLAETQALQEAVAAGRSTATL